MKKFLITSSALFFLIACVTVKVTDKEPPASGEYIGLTVEQAEAKAEGEGVPFRVVMRDSKALPITMDLRPGRINAEVENDIVVDYMIETDQGLIESETSSSSTGYDAQSWETMIADDCRSFSDGCNTCHRNPGDDLVACTKKFCMEYEMPRCIDE